MLEQKSRQKTTLSDAMPMEALSPGKAKFPGELDQEGRTFLANRNQGTAKTDGMMSVMLTNHPTFASILLCRR